MLLFPDVADVLLEPGIRNHTTSTIINLKSEIEYSPKVTGIEKIKPLVEATSLINPPPRIK